MQLMCPFIWYASMLRYRNRTDTHTNIHPYLRPNLHSPQYPGMHTHTINCVYTRRFHCVRWGGRWLYGTTLQAEAHVSASKITPFVGRPKHFERSYPFALNFITINCLKTYVEGGQLALLTTTTSCTNAHRVCARFPTLHIHTCLSVMSFDLADSAQNALRIFV